MPFSMKMTTERLLMVDLLAAELAPITTSLSSALSAHCVATVSHSTLLRFYCEERQVLMFSNTTRKLDQRSTESLGLTSLCYVK
jgi:hypothetical protein